MLTYRQEDPIDRLIHLDPSFENDALRLGSITRTLRGNVVGVNSGLSDHSRIDQIPCETGTALQDALPCWRTGNSRTCPKYCGARRRTNRRDGQARGRRRHKAVRVTKADRVIASVAVEIHSTS